MDDWEDADVKIIKKVSSKKKWEGEDVEEPKEEPKPSTTTTSTSSEPQKKVISKKKAEKLAEEEERKARKEEEEHASDPKYLASKKAEQEQLSREQDSKIAVDLFGPEHTVKRTERKEVIGLDANTLSNASEFDTFGKEVATKLALKMKEKDGVKNILVSVKSLLSSLAQSIKVEDVNEILRSTTAIYNEKLRSSKDASSGKKKTTTKKSLNLKEKPALVEYNREKNVSSDEYDFM
eukprot:TRINITY_DN969_c0_g1_i1.p1 TRINITY_DN969_c0_g1~~TRINITY_DN969_c0_g1_i1.p1  ORF type:complete len:260 (-),score=102.45 TRINITY_DN969_c0_g1_i1:206-913(-)